MSPSCPHPLPLADLLAYRQGELAPDVEAPLEEHLFGCAHCTRRLEILEQLRAGVTTLARGGQLAGSVTAQIAARVASEGAEVRTYRVNAGQVVACTAGPDDACVALRLAVAVAADETVDVETEFTHLREGTTWTRSVEDVAVDRAAGELIFLLPGDVVRGYPRSRWRMHAVVRGPQGERRVGPYTLDHTPWGERA